jgi:hypothetical protein
MLKKLFKRATAQSQEEVNSEMTTQETQPSLAVENTAELTAQLATATETLTKQAADLQALTEMVEELSAQVNTSKEALAAAEAAKLDLATQAATKRLAARTEAITKAVGTSQLPSLLAATETMEDAQFDVVVGAFAKSFETEAKSAMFQETGASAAAEVPEVDAVKRLAKKMAAKIQTK